MEGIRAELVVEDQSECPVAAVSRECGPVSDVSRSAVTDESGQGHVEFTVQGGGADALDAGTVLFRDRQRTIYRLPRTPRDVCVCSCIEREGFTVRDVRAADGALFVTVLVRELDGIKAIVSALRETHDGVRIGKLVRAPPANTAEPLWVIDPDSLTARQRDVLETAHEMGYFEYPRESSAQAVASAIGIAVPTFSEHLAAAQRNLLADLLGDPDCRPRAVARSSVQE